MSTECCVKYLTLGAQQKNTLNVENIFQHHTEN